MLTQNISPVWHPFTQMKTDPEPLKVKSAHGMMVELEDGRQLIDCISSWWVNLHGHTHPKIAEAIYQQALQLEHVIFAGYTHEPAEQLSRQLLEVLPSHFSKVYFSDNGSTAIEVALKQAYQYWINQGCMTRKKFLCFDGAYHGDTLGAMSLGSRSVFSRIFQDLLFDITTVPFPSLCQPLENLEDLEANILEMIDRELSTMTYAAAIIEPLVQGVNGMQMCRPEFLQKLQKVVHQYQTLLIYDEVMTGFGRTGDWFACSKSATTPDIICLAKGITGGFLPLAVTICTEEIYQGFYSDDRKKTLFHGHSYTANPLGCAAGLASMELLKETVHLFRGMEEKHVHYSALLKNLPIIKNLRICGTIAAMDIVTENPGYLNDIGVKLRCAFQNEGLLLRPLGNVLYLMPSYCVTDQELKLIYEKIINVFSHF